LILSLKISFFLIFFNKKSKIFRQPKEKIVVKVIVETIGCVVVIALIILLIVLFIAFMMVMSGGQ